MRLLEKTENGSIVYDLSYYHYRYIHEERVIILQTLAGAISYKVKNLQAKNFMEVEAMKPKVIVENGRREVFVWDEERFSYLPRQKQVVLRFEGETQVWEADIHNGDIVAKRLVKVIKLAEA